MSDGRDGGLGVAEAARPSFADVREAAARIAPAAVRTPLIRSDALDARTGGRVFVKAEVLQRTGSFKFRGAYNRISRLGPEELRAGVVAYSSGNHAQAVAAAAALLGTRATIVMPADAPRLKIENTRALGAEVVLYDRARESREEIAGRIQAERAAVLVPPFENRHVIAGQGTLAVEMIEDLAAAGAPPADLFFCPCSGGGLMAGSVLAFAALSPQTRLFAVEPEGFDDTARSLAAGRRVANPRTSGSLCDALLTPEPGELTFSINQPRLAGARAVSDEQALEAVAFAFLRLKIVVEPGGAAALAALLAAPPLEGRTALVVASGGNVDPDVFARAIARAAG